MAMQVPTVYKSRRQSLHESTQVTVIYGPPHEVPVIWHQTIAENAQGNAGLCLRHDLFKGGLIRLLVKNRIAGISTIENVELTAAVLLGINCPAFHRADPIHSRPRWPAMSELIAKFDRIWNRAGTWLLSARGQAIAVSVPLVTQTGPLAYSADRRSRLLSFFSVQIQLAWKRLIAFWPRIQLISRHALYLSLLIIVVWFVVTNRYADAQEQSFVSHSVPTKKLNGNARREAGAARDRADRMRAEFETRISTGPGPQSGSNVSSLTTEAEIVRAYEKVIRDYPHTEIAAYCAMRLAGFHSRLGDSDRAVELLENTSDEFAGTLLGNKVMFETGMTHSQARNDQAKAIAWFKRIPEPLPANIQKGRETSEYREALKYYVFAQQQLAKCEMNLGLEDAVEKRLSAVEHAHPEYTKQLTQFKEFEAAVQDVQRPTPRKIENKRSIHVSTVLIWQCVVLLLVAVAIVTIRRRKLSRKAK